MSSYYAGSKGRMYLNGAELARVANWTFTSTANLIPTTALGDTDSSSTPGLRTSNGTCRIYFYRYEDGDTTKNDCATLIKSLIKKSDGSANVSSAALPDKVTMKLFVNTDTADGNFIAGDAYLQNVSMVMAVGEVLAADVQFQFTGALTGLVI